MKISCLLVACVYVLSAPARGDVLAEITLEYPGNSVLTAVGVPFDFTKFDAGLSVYEPRPPVSSLFKGSLFRLRPFPASTIGTAEDTVTPSSDPGFAAVTRELTDGERDSLGLYSTVYRVGGDPIMTHGNVSSSNSDFLLGGSQRDLIGFEITSITRRVEILNITPVTNGAMFGTHRMYFRFEGHVPEPSSSVLLTSAGFLLRRRNRVKADR